MKFDFSKKIVDIRSNIKMTQGEFSEKLGISQGALSNYEKGSRIPDVMFLYRLFQEFNINPTWFFYSQESTDQELYDMFTIAIDKSNMYKTSNMLKHNIDEYLDAENALEKISSKLRSVKGVDFFSKFAEATHGRGERMSVILYKFLEYIEKTFSSNTPQNLTKSDFINMLKDFKLTGIHVRLYTESDQNNLISWVEQELDDVECYMIISNITVVSNNVKEELNILNKLTV